jgi:hypothetical protein
MKKEKSLMDDSSDYGDYNGSDSPPSSYESSLQNGLGTFSGLLGGAAGIVNAIRQPKLTQKAIAEPPKASTQAITAYLPWIIGGVVLLFGGAFLLKK